MAKSLSRGRIPIGLRKASSNRTLEALKKLKEAQRSIEAEVAAGVLSANEVTLKLLLKERADLGERFLDGKNHKETKKTVEQWRMDLSKSAEILPTPIKDLTPALKEEIAQLRLHNARLADRVHCYATRIRHLQRIVANIQARSGGEVTYLNPKKSQKPIL
ncbi:hypothetical protein [Rhizobium sp. ZW T2_16]|uniref:hypothetical protein n=1 Tax=Rhizobium sp. ZW T2_16 TaxID=3378083 RepID=UPI003853083B